MNLTNSVTDVKMNRRSMANEYGKTKRVNIGLSSELISISFHTRPTISYTIKNEWSSIHVISTAISTFPCTVTHFSQNLLRFVV